MSDDLMDQIRSYYTAIDEAGEAIQLAEVEAGLSGSGARPALVESASSEDEIAVLGDPGERRPRRRAWGLAMVGAAAAALLALVVAVAPGDSEDTASVASPGGQADATVNPGTEPGIVLLGPGSWSVAATAADGGVSIAELEALAGQIGAWPGVLEVAVAPDASAWRTLTGFDSDGCGPGGEGPPCGPGLALRAVGGQVEPIARRLQSELGMTTLVAHVEPWTVVDGYLAAVIDRASPVPLSFDPASLGREVELSGPFVDVSADDGCLNTTCPVAVDLEVGDTVHRFSLAVVSPDDVSPEDDIEFNDRAGVALGISERGATGVGFFQARDLLPGSGGSVGIVGNLGGGALGPGRRSFIVAGLPVDAAVVTTRLSDGSQVWQRPLAGMAVVADAEGTFSPDGPFGSMTVLDADGNEILLIEGTDGNTPLVTNLGPNGDAIAEAAISPTGPDDTVEAAGLTITWTEVTPGENEPPAVLVDTPAGVIGARRNGDVVRWTDGARWIEVAALTDVDVRTLTDGTDFILASGTDRRSGAPVLLQSTDGQTWTSIDRTTLEGTGAEDAFATTPSGLTLFHDPGQDDRVIIATIDGDRLTGAHPAPWSPDDCCDLVGLLEFDGSAVALRRDFNEPRVSEAWAHLGGSEWASPEPVPLGDQIVQINENAFMFDDTDSVWSSELRAVDTTATLLSTTDGIRWEPHSVLDALTTTGPALAAGDSFLVYGPGGIGGPGPVIEREFVTLWISPDAATWSPLDLSFARGGCEPHETMAPRPCDVLVRAVGDLIIVTGGEAEPYWIATVKEG